MEEQIAPNVMCDLLKPDLVGGGKTNYVSNSQLFKCTIQLENSLADHREQSACTNTANPYPSSLEKTGIAEETCRFSDGLLWMAQSWKA